MTGDICHFNLHSAKIFNVEGRMYPVRLMNTVEPQKNYIEAALTCTFQIHLEMDPVGDILAFFTGQEEIETMERMLNEYAKQCPPNAPKVYLKNNIFQRS